jgi:hypothetical protein
MYTFSGDANSAPAQRCVGTDSRNSFLQVGADLVGLVEGQNGRLCEWRRALPGKRKLGQRGKWNELVGPRIVKSVGHMGAREGDSAATVSDSKQKATLQRPGLCVNPIHRLRKLDSC